MYRHELEPKTVPRYFKFKALAHCRGDWLACQLPIEITVEPGARVDGKSCTIIYSATTESRVYEKRSLSTRNRHMPDTVELSPSTRGLHFHFWRWTRPYIMGIADEWIVELRGCTELFDFLREHRLLPKRHKRMTQGRLSGAEYRLFEEENALPTSEVNPVRTRKRDFYKPRPEDRRDGRKPIRPWTRQQRGALMADEKLLR